MSFEACDHVAHVHLHLTPIATPEIRRHCARCKGTQSFESSGKFRVNANGKMLDAWLIYRCSGCELAWNYPIHERRASRRFDGAELQALMQNDAALATRYASDIEGLRAAGAEILAVRDVAVRRTMLLPAPASTSAIHVSITAAASCKVRLDRVLAWALSLRRSDVLALHASGALLLQSLAAKALKRPTIGTQRIALDLAHVSTEMAAACRAAMCDKSETLRLD